MAHAVPWLSLDFEAKKDKRFDPDKIKPGRRSRGEWSAAGERHLGFRWQDPEFAHVENCSRVTQLALLRALASFASRSSMTYIGPTVRPG